MYFANSNAFFIYTAHWFNRVAILAWESAYSYLQMVEYLHFGIFVVFVLIVLVAYIKIKYPFWNIQPVYHTYDYWRTLFYSNPYIVYANPVKTKFCDFKRVKTIKYVDCSPEQRHAAMDLIQCYQYKNNQIINTVLQTELDVLLSNGGFLSFYCLDDYIQSEHIQINTKPIGVLGSYPITLFFLNENISVFYFDYLAVNRNLSNHTLINRNLFQTHEYNQRVANMKDVNVEKSHPIIKCSLFKVAFSPLDGVVPLFKYQSFNYQISITRFARPELPNKTYIQRIYTDNYDMITDFMNTHMATKMAKLYAVLDTGSLISLIRNGVLYVYCLRKGKDIYGYYFFKDVKQELENVGAVLRCIGSFMNMTNGEVFFDGFLYALNNIQKMTKSKYKILCIDDVNHNRYILNIWNKQQQNQKPLTNYWNYWYLFNYIVPGSPVDKENVFVLL